jgi:hypothetical protein
VFSPIPFTLGKKGVLTGGAVFENRVIGRYIIELKYTPGQAMDTRKKALANSAKQGYWVAVSTIYFPGLDI